LHKSSSPSAGRGEEVCSACQQDRSRVPPPSTESPLPRPDRRRTRTSGDPAPRPGRRRARASVGSATDR
jgi:hypothetical protein